MTAWHQRNRSSMLDYRQRKRDDEKLDAYGVAMSFDPVQTPEDILLAREQTAVIDAEMAKRLSPREERVVRLRMDGLTFEAIGKLYGVERERIRQIEAKAHRVMKRPLMAYMRPEVIAAERLKTAAEDKARRAAVTAEAKRKQAEYEQERAERAEFERVREEEVNRLRREYAHQNSAEALQKRKEREERASRINWLRWKQEAAARAWAKEQSIAAWRAQLGIGMGNVFAPEQKPEPKKDPRWTEQDWEAWEDAREIAREHQVKRDWIEVATKGFA